MLGRWCEHGGNTQSQAKPGDGSEDIGAVACPLENRAIVELHVVGTAMLLPERE